MSEITERMKDSALLEQFDIDPHLRISTGLAMVIQRQLVALASQTGVQVEKMNREFLVEQLCKVNISSAEQANAEHV